VVLSRAEAPEAITGGAEIESDASLHDRYVCPHSGASGSRR
jgi:uncharacterized phage protein gp47/JayE